MNPPSILPRSSLARLVSAADRVTTARRQRLMTCGVETNLKTRPVQSCFFGAHSRSFSLARDGRPRLEVRPFQPLDLDQGCNPEISYPKSATINHWRGRSREKDEHVWSSSGGSRDIVCHPDFGSVVAREGLVGIVRQCLRPGRTTVDCNERRRRCAEDGTTGSAPLRSRRNLLLGEASRAAKRRLMLR
jgi:hypothetical protein